MCGIFYDKLSIHISSCWTFSVLRLELKEVKTKNIIKQYKRWTTIDGRRGFLSGQ